MANTEMEIKIRMPRRRATVTQNASQAAFNKLTEGANQCHVLGLFQFSDGEEEVRPYFICELNDGRCIYADPIQVTFLDTDENGDIVE